MVLCAAYVSVFYVVNNTILKIAIVVVKHSNLLHMYIYTYIFMNTLVYSFRGSYIVVPQLCHAVLPEMGWVNGSTLLLLSYRVLCSMYYKAHSCKRKQSASYGAIIESFKSIE